MRAGCYHQHHQNYGLNALTSPPPSSTAALPLNSPSSFAVFSAPLFSRKRVLESALGLSRGSVGGKGSRGVIVRRKNGINVVASSKNAAAPLWDAWKPEKASSAPSFSDILWPSAGAFAAMAILGKIDQFLVPKGISLTIAPLGAVSAVLFTTPSAPAARKYNMFMAQIGCATIGVLAFSLFGPGWLARSAALATSTAFMIYTRSTHPPAASLPLLFIDVPKFHHLNFWYAIFPGAMGCIILSLIQEMVTYLKDNVKF